MEALKLLTTNAPSMKAEEVAYFEETWGALQKCINLDAIAAFCQNIRNARHQTSEQHIQEAVSTAPTIGFPWYGSYNLAFPIDFEDGVKWVLKFPRAGESQMYTTQVRQRCLNEVKVMQLLHRETTIPVPEVYAYDITLDNELGCPYILMQFMPGKQLAELWFSTHGTALFRQRALQSIAEAMAQLDKFEFSTGGTPNFNIEDDSVTIGPETLEDYNITQKHIFLGTHEGKDFTFETGPHIDPQPAYIAFEEYYAPSVRPGPPETEHLLRQFLQWIPEPEDKRKPFVLTHPDFNVQNILVSDDGHLTGLIDWDGVKVVPRSMGYESLPAFLTIDWDPYFYPLNNPLRDQLEESCRPPCDSPQTLEAHRREYCKYMQDALQQVRTVNGVKYTDVPSYTGNSLLVLMLIWGSQSYQNGYHMLDIFISEINRLRRLRIAELDSDDSEEDDDDDDSETDSQYDSIDDDYDSSLNHNIEEDEASSNACTDVVHKDYNALSEEETARIFETTRDTDKQDDGVVGVAKAGICGTSYVLPATSILERCYTAITRAPENAMLAAKQSFDHYHLSLMEDDSESCNDDHDFCDPQEVAGLTTQSFSGLGSLFRKVFEVYSSVFRHTRQDDCLSYEATNIALPSLWKRIYGAFTVAAANVHGVYQQALFPADDNNETCGTPFGRVEASAEVARDIEQDLYGSCYGLSNALPEDIQEDLQITPEDDVGSHSDNTDEEDDIGDSVVESDNGADVTDDGRDVSDEEDSDDEDEVGGDSVDHIDWHKSKLAFDLYNGNLLRIQLNCLKAEFQSLFRFDGQPRDAPRQNPEDQTTLVPSVPEVDSASRHD